MKQFIVTFLLLCLVSVGAIAAPPDTTILGTWQGALSIQGIQLRLVVRIRDSAGVLLSVIDSPDQNVAGIPVASTMWDRKTLKLGIPAIGASYAGEYNPATAHLVGPFTQGGKSLPLDLVKNDVVKPLLRPQEPHPPYPYKVEELTFKGLQQEVLLASTITVPNGKGPFPAVVLITGSGPQNRDEELMGHKPFMVIADYLTRNGIAVLRYDDRGVGKSRGNFDKATSADFATDAIAAVNVLMKRKDIDHKRIGLIGHSEGGLVAPIASTQSKDIAFIVMLAGPGIDGRQILQAQGPLILQSQGVADTTIAKYRVMQSRTLAIAQSDVDDSLARIQLLNAFNEEVVKLTPAESEALGMNKESGVMYANQALGQWFRYFLRYDPQPTLRKVSVPVLAMNGEKDMQVPSKQNLDAINAALKEGGNKNYSTVEMAGMNHLFQECTSCTIGEYMQIEQTMSPKALQTISDWIKGLK